MAADHIELTKNALAQLPFTKRGGRVGRKVLVRTDGAGSSHELANWLARQGLSYSIGFTLTQAIVDAVNALRDETWIPAYDSEPTKRAGAKVGDSLSWWTWANGRRGCG